MWKARLAVRKKLLERAQRGLNFWRAVKRRCAHRTPAWHHAGHRILEREKLVKKRQAQVAEAQRGVARHQPLRLKAWGEMQHLIDLKVTEAGGNNHGPMVEEIIRANGGVPGEPWCGDTVAYCYLEAGSKSVARAWASVSMLERLLSRCFHPKRGHIVTYSFSHTGLFDRWAPEHGSGWFLAGEGNTGNAGAVSDSVTGGDGVKLKLRHTSQVSSFRKVLR